MKRHAAAGVMLAAALLLGAACGGSGSGDAGPASQSGAGPSQSEQGQGSQTAEPAGRGETSTDGPEGSGRFIADVPQISAGDWAALMVHALEHWEWDDKAAVARSPLAPPELLRYIVERGGGLGFVAAQNPSAPDGLLARYAAEAQYAQLIAEWPDAPADVLRSIAGQADPGVRRWLAANPNTPGDALRSLADDPDPALLQRIAENPNTPADVLRSLADDPELVGHVAASPNAPGDLLARIVDDPEQSYWSGLRWIAAANPFLPADVLDRLGAEIAGSLPAGPRQCNDPSGGAAPAEEEPIEGGEAPPRPPAGVELMAPLAANPSLPAGVLNLLARHGPGDASHSLDVMNAVAANPSTPADALAQIASDCPASFEAYHIATNPSAPADALADLANSASEGVREAVAEHPRATGNLLALLANDPEPDVREAAAANPNTPGEALALLAGDPESDVREAAATNPNTPPAALQLLAQGVGLHREVAANPNTSEQVRFELWLLNDPSGLAARYGYLTDTAMARIAEAVLSGVKHQVLVTMVAFHPDTSAGALEELAASSDESVRAAVASSPNTPAEVLDALARDNHPDVRRAAAAELSRRGG